MGLLALGTPLSWPETLKNADKVRDWGLQQLLSIYHRALGKSKDALLWGDEIEYLVVHFDESTQKARLVLRSAEILLALAENPVLCSKGGVVPDLQPIERQEDALPVFHPEFGRFMLESTPGSPWSCAFPQLLQVERNMCLRRKLIQDHLKPGEASIMMTTFPLLGTGDFIDPYFPPLGEKLRSQFVPDEIANPHIRFPTLAAHIRERRGRKVEIPVPIFVDEKTPRPWRDPTVNYDLHQWPEDDDVRNGAVKDDFVYLDAMAFGMGSCCLQVTFQAKNLTEARTLYDQLTPLAPILMAVTAATPIYKGFLVDTDARWNQISRSVDDRTREELGEKPRQSERQRRIPKSRYASNSTYIAQDPRLRKEYQDPDLVIDGKIKQSLMDGGMDDLLARHFAHLFVRDPLVVFAEDLKELDLNKSDMFEQIQSTNWSSVRFKPPPPNSPIGWRVEFRTLENSITNWEQAAFTIFIVLLSRAILSYDLNFYMPIRLVDENMETAHKRDAVLNDKFHFRKDPFPKFEWRMNGAAAGSATPTMPSRPTTPTEPVEKELELLSIAEIINGSDKYPGLIPLVEGYLNSVNIDVETRCALARYLDLIRKRASGALPTGARWIRNFVRGHPDYKYDSVVSEKICFDLLKTVDKITEENGEGPTGRDLFRVSKKRA